MEFFFKEMEKKDKNLKEEKNNKAEKGGKQKVNFV